MSIAQTSYPTQEEQFTTTNPLDHARFKRGEVIQAFREHLAVIRARQEYGKAMGDDHEVYTANTERNTVLRLASRLGLNIGGEYQVRHIDADEWLPLTREEVEEQFGEDFKDVSSAMETLDDGQEVRTMFSVYRKAVR